MERRKIGKGLWDTENDTMVNSLGFLFAFHILNWILEKLSNWMHQCVQTSKQKERKRKPAISTQKT